MRRIRGGKRKPESIIQGKIIQFLKARDWDVRVTHGNEFQSGFPDLYCCHLKYGSRWIDVKNPAGYSFTPAQMEVWPAWSAKGVGVWILIGATEEEYKKLFKPANFMWYLGVMK
jgi:hypothetical protein